MPIPAYYAVIAPVTNHPILLGCNEQISCEMRLSVSILNMQLSEGRDVL
jgi:hypothetical protein